MLVLESNTYLKDPPDISLEAWWQVLVNIEADFTAYVDGDVLVQDSHWCAVECAQQLKSWLKDSSQAFSYTSMDTGRDLALVQTRCRWNMARWVSLADEKF